MTSAARTTPRGAGGHRAEGRGYGLIFFAAILLLVVSFFNMIYGIAAIANSHVFVVNAHYVFANLRTWGWITLIIAVLQLAAAGGILAGNQLARWFAVAVLALNAIDMMLFLPAYPFWALTIIAMDVVALYGLCAYGSRQNLDAVLVSRLRSGRDRNRPCLGGIAKPGTGPVSSIRSVPFFAGPWPGFPGPAGSLVHLSFEMARARRGL